MNVIQFTVPCSDDFIGPFEDHEEVRQFVRENCPDGTTYLIHHMVSPFRVTGSWHTLEQHP